MSFHKLKSVQDNHAAAGGKALGTLLWWHLAGNRIDHQGLEQLAHHHGLADKYLPAELKPVQAFRRACRHAAAKMPKGMMLRPIGESADEIVVGLVTERPDAAARDLDYDVVARITFDKRTDAMATDVENAQTWEVQQLFRHHQAHTTEDLRSMLTTFLGEAGVSLRDAGGVYFVPAAFQGTLDALCSVVEAAGKNITYQLPIVETAETKGTLREVAKRSLEDEIEQLQAELQRFETTKVRQSTLERKLEGFDELRARVTMFARVLSFKADALNDKISGIQGDLRRQLSGGDHQVTTAEATAPMPPVAAAAGGVGF